MRFKLCFKEIIVVIGEGWVGRGERLELENLGKRYCYCLGKRY